MTHDDVKLYQVFLEATKPPHTKHGTPRRVKVVARGKYTALVRVLEGRGVGFELRLPLKRLTDPTKWTMETPS